MRSVALRREVLLSNEKWLRSSCLNASKPFRRLRRHFSQASPALLDGLRPSLLAARSRRSSQMFIAFSTDLVRHFSRYPFAALLKCFAPSRGFQTALRGGLGPPLLDGFTVTSRRFHRHFSNALCPSVGFADTSRRLRLHFPRFFKPHFSPVSPALLKCL